MKTAAQIIHDLNELLEFESGQNHDKVQALFLRGRIPGPILERHDHLRSRGQRSISVVKKGVCTGCRVSLSPEHWLHMQERTRGGLNVCNHCGRIICLVDDMVNLPANSVINGLKTSLAAKKTRVPRLAVHGA